MIGHWGDVLRFDWTTCDVNHDEGNGGLNPLESLVDVNRISFLINVPMNPSPSSLMPKHASTPLSI